MGAACAPGRRCTCRKNGARSDGGGTRNRPRARGPAAAVSLSGRSPRAPQSFSQGQASEPPVAESDKALFGTFKSAPMRRTSGRVLSRRGMGLAVALERGRGVDIGLLQLDAPIAQLLERDRTPGDGAAHEIAGRYHLHLA